MRKLQYCVAVVVACLVPRGLPLEPGDAAQPVAPKLARWVVPGLPSGTAATLRSSAGCEHSPVNRVPTIESRPRQAMRVLDGPVVPIGDHWRYDRWSFPNETSVRFALAPPGFRAVERCILLCRFLL